jgi:hypothetical protein
MTTPNLLNNNSSISNNNYERSVPLPIVNNIIESEANTGTNSSSTKKWYTSIPTVPEDFQIQVSARDQFNRCYKKLKNGREANEQFSVGVIFNAHDIINNFNSDKFTTIIPDNTKYRVTKSGLHEEDVIKQQNMSIGDLYTEVVRLRKIILDHSEVVQKLINSFLLLLYYY